MEDYKVDGQWDLGALQDDYKLEKTRRNAPKVKIPEPSAPPAMEAGEIDEFEDEEEPILEEQGEEFEELAKVDQFALAMQLVKDKPTIQSKELKDANTNAKENTNAPPAEEEEGEVGETEEV